MTMTICIDFEKPPVSIFVSGYYGRKIMEEKYNNCFKTLVKTVEQLEALVKENY